jgi:site-specific DNA recombinase
VRCVLYLRVSTKEQAERDLTEEGFSIPAQREACARHVRQGWTLIDEYSDRGESARSADRPQLQAMLARIVEDRDVDAVVVHKVDRLVRNIEDHVAIRAALRRCGVALVSVTENLEETASGRLVEGIHALMAEFYSSNLSSEIRKGMTQKAKMGGWPHQAPLGYRNVRQSIGGRQVAHIVPDPDRAPLIGLAFELYATGEYTLERLTAELEHRGLRNRGRRNARPKPLTLNGLSVVLGNKAYVGVVEWNGVEYRGMHEPLVPTETFQRVQDLLASRASRGVRERKPLPQGDAALRCVCGRRLSCQLSKGAYLYFFCLGQKNGGVAICRERYVPADRLEDHVVKLYQPLQLSEALVDRLVPDMQTEIVARQSRNAVGARVPGSQAGQARRGASQAARRLLRRRHRRGHAQGRTRPHRARDPRRRGSPRHHRRPPPGMADGARHGHALHDQLRQGLHARRRQGAPTVQHLGFSPASPCATGRSPAGSSARPSMPFSARLGSNTEVLWEVMPPDTNHRVKVAGPVLRLGKRKPESPTCRERLVSAAVRLTKRTGVDTFLMRELVPELRASGVQYRKDTVYKTIRRMTGRTGRSGWAEFEQVEPGRLRLRPGVARLRFS